MADIDRALAFYRDVLGFEEMARYGDQAVFISAGGYHHHLGLNTWESKGGSPPPPVRVAIARGSLPAADTSDRSERCHRAAINFWLD